MFAVTDVEARIRRLEELARGFAREVTLWREANDPLLYLERRAYLNAIQDALAGVETARVVLARASQRIQSGARWTPPDPPETAANETVL